MPWRPFRKSGADDLVILCRKGKADEALQRLREIMDRLKLTVNEQQTRMCKVPEGEFDFLGYTFGADVFGEDRQSLPGLGTARRKGRQPRTNRQPPPHISTLVASTQ